ncbi:MAG: tetratricopeptide repeat protein [Planctomycetota bacterium]
MQAHTYGYRNRGHWAVIGPLAILVLLLVCGCEEIAPEGLSILEWSPDGRMLASIYADILYIGAPDGTIPLRRFDDLALAENHLSWSPDSGAIAYTSAKAGGWDIWVLDVRKGQSVRVTHHPAKDCRPHWHPSGKKIFFLSWRSRQPDLWEFDIVTGKARQLTDDALEETDVTLSRTGDCLAFAGVDTEGAASVMFLDVGRGGPVEIVPRSTQLGKCAIDPSGERVCFAWGNELRVVDMGGVFGRRTVQVVATAAEGPITDCRWSPDGKRILFLAGGRVQIRSLELFGAVSPLAPSAGNDRLPRWSPTGELVAYSAVGESGRPLVALVNAKTGRRGWLTQSMSDSLEAGRYAARVGCWEECARVLEEGLREYPPGADSAEAMDLATRAYAHLGRYEKILALREALTTNPTGRGIVYLICYEDLERARSEFEKASAKDAEAQDLLQLMKENKADVVKAYCRGELAVWRDKYAAAASEFENFLSQARDSAITETAAYDLGGLYEKEPKEPEKALNAFARAIERFPSSSRKEDAILARGRILQQMGRTTDAVAEFARLRESPDPDNRLEALTTIAQLREKTGDAAGAIPYYRLAVGSLPPVDPESPLLKKRQAERLQKQAELASKIIELHARLKRPDAAQSAARDLLQRAWTSPAERESAIPRLVDAFDRSGLHEGGTALIEWAHREGNTSVDFGGQIEEWIRMRDYIPRQVLVRCELGRLPSWAEERLKIFARIAETRQGGAGGFEAASLRMVAARDPSEIEKTLSSLKPGGGLSEGQIAILNALGHYMIGNVCQTKQDIKQAMVHYRKMYEAAKDEDFLRVLDGCMALLPDKKHVLQRWLDAEREAGKGIWNGSERLLGKGLSEEALRAKYEDFIRDFPGFNLAGDAYFRAAMLAPHPIRERYLEKAATQYPDCDTFEEAFYALSEEYSKRANWWLFARFIEDLIEAPRQAGHRAFYELWLATIYGEVLKDVPTARKHIQVLFDKFKGGEEWAMAKRLNASYLMDEKKYQEAINEVKDLVRERPGDPWVQRGRALQSMAQCHEEMGNWAEAELEYAAFIETYRDAPDVATGKLLARILPRMNPDAMKYLYNKLPGDFVKAAVQLKEEEQGRLYDLLPGLQRRVKEAEAKYLKGESKQGP